MWKTFSKPTSADFEEDKDEDFSDEGDEIEDHLMPAGENENSEFIKCDKEKGKYNSCFKCRVNLIFQYNMYSRLYTELYKVYKYRRILSATQVSCEGSFSNLRSIKTTF